MKYLRKIIRIKADQSPNVRYALHEISQGRQPSGRMIVPGVLSYDDYLHRRTTWDEPRQSVGLDATFWEGADVLLYPTHWLDRAERLATTIDARVRKRQVEAMGIDPGEGSADTAWTLVDKFGIMAKLSIKTPDTSVITARTIQLGREFGLESNGWVFDRGGGGLQIADGLRRDGYRGVRTVGFGEAVTVELKRGRSTFAERRDVKEERTAYRNRRAQMYGELRALLDPSNEEGFAIPAQYAELRRQLGLMPLLYDKEGTLYLPPKSKRAGQVGETLEDIIGHSPDEADSLVLAVHGMIHKSRRSVAGVV